MPGMFTDGSGLDSDGVHDASASAATAAMVSQGSPWRRDTTGAGVRLFFVLLPLAMMRVRSLLFDAGSRSAPADHGRSAGWPVADGPVYVPRPSCRRERTRRALWRPRMLGRQERVCQIRADSLLVSHG